MVLSFVAGWLLGWWLHAAGPQAPVVAEPPQTVTRMAAAGLPLVRGRCHTITYSYSDGSAQTYHRCQGHTEFTDAFGKSVAPKGATLVSAKGGVHRGFGIVH